MAEGNYSRPVRCLVTIVDRGKSRRVEEILEEHGVGIRAVCLGSGTVSSEKLSLFGLGDLEKDVVVSLAPAEKARHLMLELRHRMQYDKPGKGIAFTVAVSAFNSAVMESLREGSGEETPLNLRREVEGVELSQGYHLIVTVINHGESDLVMQAARSQGAGGGTVVRARSLSGDDAEKFLKIRIQAEKEIVLIAVPNEDRKRVMQAVCNSLTGSLGERGLMFSLPIEDITGLTSVGE